MIATLPFVADSGEHECVLVCYCTACDGRSWPDFDVATVHLDTVPPGTEIVLVNVELN